MSPTKKQAPVAIRRFGSEKSAQITFTLDFHELITGNLVSNTDCLISYDPTRLIPANSGYVHGDPAQPVTLNYQFSSNDPVNSQVLVSRVGLLASPVLEATGLGSMLEGEIAIPADAQELIIWFSYVDSNGVTHYDSDLGKNFRFRFASQDIQLLQAVVTSDPQTPYSGFGVEVAAIPAITGVTVRFSAINVPDFPKTELPLSNTGKNPDGKIIWSIFGVAVPYRANIRFKLYYVVNGIPYKDDNAGSYFMAPIPG